MKAFAVFALILAWAPAPASAADNALGFSIQVSLSPKAAARLAASRESIEAAALWYGEPGKGARKHAAEDGQIYIGDEKVRLPGSGGGAEFSGRTVKTAQIAWLKNREARINLNVYSARLGGPDNILDCDLFEGAVAKARAGTVRISCKLIGEK